MEANGQLTGGIAHDFNNALAVIVGGIDLARRRLAKGDKDVTRFLDSALDGAQLAAALTRRLLAFSRRTPLQPQVIDMNRQVAGMSEVLRLTLGEQVAAETVLAGGLWNVEADPGQLEAVMLNLADAARTKRPDLKVLYATGYTKNAAVHHGVVDADAQLIVKPFTLDLLARRVRQALDA
jgi:signal transduction histidine kinase